MREVLVGEVVLVTVSDFELFVETELVNLGCLLKEVDYLLNLFQ